MIHNLVTTEEAQSLIQFHKEHLHLVRIGSKEEYQGIRFCHIKTQWVRDLLMRVVYDLIGQIRLISGQMVVPEMIGINNWSIGGEQHPHLDIYSNQEMDLNTHHGTPAREWTCILYLNDDLKGGETYIPGGKIMCHDNVQREYEDQVYPPVANSGLLFQGIYIPHGVSKVRRNSRYTVSLWFSSNMKKQMPTHPIHLDSNEDLFRIHLDEQGPAFEAPIEKT